MEKHNNNQQHMVTTHSLTSASLVTVSKPMQSHSAFHKRKFSTSIYIYTRTWTILFGDPLFSSVPGATFVLVVRREPNPKHRCHQGRSLKHSHDCRVFLHKVVRWSSHLDRHPQMLSRHLQTSEIFRDLQRSSE